MYEIFSQHPHRAKRFGNAMASFEKGTGYDLKYLVNNFPWESLSGGTVVDVSYSVDQNVAQWISSLIRLGRWLEWLCKHSSCIFISETSLQSARPPQSRRRWRFQSPFQSFRSCRIHVS